MLSINLSQIIQEINSRRKHIKYDFQELGLMLCAKLNDPSHKSLYMKLAKNEEQELLIDSLNYILTGKNISGNMGALFMWKLKELKARPLLPVNLRYVLSNGYYVIGSIQNLKRGDMPIILAGLKQYEEEHSGSMKFTKVNQNFENLAEYIVEFSKEFGCKPQLKMNNKWVWKGLNEEGAGGVGSLMLDKPSLTKQQYRSKIPPSSRY